MRISILFLVLLIASCTGKKGAESDTSVAKVKFEQYLVEGQTLYQQHCSNCHQLEGQGLAQLFPPLAGSDYLNADINRAICIIKNGQQGEIVVNGVTYNQMMPGVTNLTNLEVAEISTYIYNSWGNEKGMIGIKKVEQALAACE